MYNLTSRKQIVIGLCVLYIFLAMPKSVFGQLQFIENKGQWDNRILYKTSINHSDILLVEDGIVLFERDGLQIKKHHDHQSNDSLLHCHAVKITFLGANVHCEKTAHQPSADYRNYFIGNRPDRWKSKVYAFEKVVYHEFYPLTDLEIYSYGGQLKYNLVLRPGADPSLVNVAYEGADGVTLNEDGINIRTSLSTILEENPYCYQIDKDGNEKKIASSYRLTGNTMSFHMKESYPKERVLVIDPVFVFGTFSGSTADNFGFTGTYDKDGNAYSGGTVYAAGFPVTFGAFQLSWKSGVNVDRSVGDIRRDVGILKYSDDGKQLLWATYLGGAHNEDPHSLVVNSNNELIVFGNTGSGDFPRTINAYDTSFNGNYDIFVSRFSEDGTLLLASTFVGGSGRDGLNGRQAYVSGVFMNTSDLGYNYGDEYRGEININLKDEVFVTTTTLSEDFPVTATAFQKTKADKHDAVIFKLNPSLTTLMASTYFGGNGQDAGYSIAIDTAGNPYMAGGTTSDNLPIPSTAYQAAYQGAPADGMIAHFNTDFSKVTDATYYGTAKYDQIYFVQLDEHNHVYVTGQTSDTGMVVKNARAAEKHGKQFIVKFNPSLTQTIYASKFGSGRTYPDLSPSAFLVDVCERVYFSGWGGQDNLNGHMGGLTITPDAFQKTTDSSDFYLAVFAKGMDSLIYASYFGGDTSKEHVDGGTSRFSKEGVVYQSVCGGCGGGYSDFPTTPGAWSRKDQAVTGNHCNNAFFKIDFGLPVLIADFELDDALCDQEIISPKNKSIGATSFFWDFGDGTTSNLKNPTHQYADTGIYIVKMIATNPVTCTFKDTITKKIVIYHTIKPRFSIKTDPCGQLVNLQYTGNQAAKLRWYLDGLEIDNLENFQYFFPDTGVYTIKLVAGVGSGCADSVMKTIRAIWPIPRFTYTADSCSNLVKFKNLTVGASNIKWQFNKSNFSTLDSPFFDYALSGSHTVILRVNEGRYCYDSVIQDIITKPIEREANFDFKLDTCNMLVRATNTSKVFTGIRWQYDTSQVTGNDIQFHHQSGKVKLLMTVDPFSTCPDTISKFIHLTDLPIAKFYQIKDTCTSTVKFVNQSQNSTKFRWRFPDGFSSVKDPVVQFKDTGSYEVILYAEPFSQCVDTVTAKVEIRNVRYALFNVNLIDCTDSIRITNQSKNTNVFHWIIDTLREDYAYNPGTILTNGPGNYTILLITDEGFGECSDSFSLTIKVDSLPKADFDFVPNLCAANFQFMSKSIAMDSVQWQIDSIWQSTGNQTFEHYFNTPGQHQVKLVVFDQKLCSDSITKKIEVPIIPKASLLTTLDSCTLLLEIKNTSDSIQPFLWQMGENQSETRRVFDIQLPESDTIFPISLVLNPKSPCADTVAQTIDILMEELKSLLIPNVFTPNGDGVNDVFTVQGLRSRCLVYEFVIFNRWGQLMFSSTEEEIRWDGKTSQGVECAPGVYFFIIKTANDRSIEGTVTLIR